MASILLYSTGKLLTDHQSGGTKRFIELAKYLTQKYDADFCSRDDALVVKKNELKQRFKMKSAKRGVTRFLPPEARLLLSNIGILKTIKRLEYSSVVSFDVPPTLGLCICNVKHIKLMIRKDMLGYEMVNGQKLTISKHMKLQYLHICEAICLKKSEIIVTQCEYDKLQLLKRHPWIRNEIQGKIKVQINNANPSWIVKKSKVHINKNIDDSIFTVGFVGNFNDERKGHDMFLEAANQLTECQNNIVFQIVGGGRQWDYYRNKYCKDKIKFHGRIENPLTVMKTCDLIVVPSKADSCPNTVMEALYNNILVIGSNTGGIPEILQDREALFELDVEDLKNKIVEICNSEKIRNMLCNKQKKRLSELIFDWSEKIADIIEI